MDVRYRSVSKFKSFDRKLQAHLKRNITAASQDAVAMIRDNIDTPGYNNIPLAPGIVVVGRRPRTIDHRRSKPFDFPYEQTGDLYDSIAYRVQRSAGIASRIGSNSPYILAMEYGRPEINLAPRPLLFRTILQHRNRIARIMLRPL